MTNYKWYGPTKAAEGMDADLEWLARNVSEWDDDAVFGAEVFSHIRKDLSPSGKDMAVFGFGKTGQHSWFTKPQWLQARKDLGLVMSDEEEEMQAPEWGSNDTIKTSVRQLRYLDANGEDWIDEFARTASVDEFRGAMRFTIGKYNRRAGKKDELVKEIEKMRDYCDRWLAYEAKAND